MLLRPSRFPLQIAFVAPRKSQADKPIRQKRAPKNARACCATFGLIIVQVFPTFLVRSTDSCLGVPETALADMQNDSVIIGPFVHRCQHTCLLHIDRVIVAGGVRTKIGGPPVDLQQSWVLFLSLSLPLSLPLSLSNALGFPGPRPPRP